MYKSYASTVSSTYGSRPRLLYPVTETAAIIAQKDSYIRPDYTSQRFSAPIKPEETIINSISTVRPENIRLTTDFSMKPKTNKTSTSTIRPEVPPLSPTEPTGHLKMMVLKLPCDSFLAKPHQGRTSMHTLTRFFMVLLQGGGCQCFLPFVQSNISYMLEKIL